MIDARNATPNCQEYEGQDGPHGSVGEITTEGAMRGGASP